MRCAVLAAVGALLSTACGGDDGSPDPDGASFETSETAETGSTGGATSTTQTTTSGSTGTTTPETSSTSAADSSTTSPAMDTWENWAHPQFFEVYCNACHPGQSPRDFSVYEVVQENVEHIYCGTAPQMQPTCDDHIEPGHLPIGDGPKPSDDERWRLIEWIDAGMPRD